MAARGEATRVAIGFPVAALGAAVLWLDFHGAGIGTNIAAAVVLVLLTAVAGKISLVVAPRTSVSAGGAFLVAAALTGGPLVGVLAGVCMEAFTTRDVWRKRSAYAGAGALQGLAVGLVGGQLSSRAPGGAAAAGTLGLVAGFAMNTVAAVLVARDRGVALRPELLAAWPAIVLSWVLPAPLVVSFLFLFGASPALALTLASGVLLLVAAGNGFRLRLERTLAAERSRARVDALTSAPNRHALAEALAAEQARIRRGGRPAGVCFLDLDRFKTVNDTYGYAAGDRLLVDVYERVRADLRATDLVFRWGGEEFVVLAPHLEAAELANFAERLRLLLESRPFAIEGRPRTITASVGAVLLEETRPAEAALEAAGRLVRKAKLTRNTVVVEHVPLEARSRLVS